MQPRIALTSCEHCGGTRREAYDDYGSDGEHRESHRPCDACADEAIYLVERDLP